MKEEIDRLKEIYEDLKQQYEDRSCPIMILSALEPEDRQYLRDNLRTICWAYNTGQRWGRTLLAYMIVDYVYENYAENEDKSINLWPLISEYLNPYGEYPREKLIDITNKTFETFHLPIIHEGKSFFNTVLLNSSSTHYSGRFFSYISNEYENKIEEEIDYDLKELADTISDEFIRDPVKSSLMTNSFNLLIKNKSLFPVIFDRVVMKLHQRRCNEIEYDLGRWEEAFNKWYLESNSAKHTRIGAELSLIDDDGEYYLNLLFPSSKAVPSKYSIELRIGDKCQRMDASGGIIRGVTVSKKILLRYPIHTIDILGPIYARDSTGVVLLNVPASDVRFFTVSGLFVKTPSAGAYKVLVRRDVEHNLPKIFADSISESIEYMDTKLEMGMEYHVGKTNIVLERHLSKKSISLIFPSIGNSYAISEDVPHIVPKHPSLAIETRIPKLHISIKRYDGRYVYNDYKDVESGILDLNDLLPPETDLSRLNLSYEGYRLASVKYMLIGNFTIRAEDLILSRSSEDIPFTDFEGDDVLPVFDNAMFVSYPIEIHGKEFDTNELEGTIKIAPGCIPDGETVYLIIRSPMGTETIPDTVTDGVCFYAISDHIQELQRKGLKYGIEIRYGDSIFPILHIDTLGKYDIEIHNDIVAITPYKLPSSCRAKYEYSTRDESIAGPLELNKTVLFDIEKPSYVKVTELNLLTNEKLVIYEKSNLFIAPQQFDVDDKSIPDRIRAEHLLTGNGCISDIQGAIRILQSLSAEGDKDATLRLARLYLNGSIIPADLKKASDYFTLYMGQNSS